MDHETAVSNAKIADRILAPAARQNDKEARFSSEISALGLAGLLGIMLPTELGAQASDDGPSPRLSQRLRKQMRRPRWFI